MNATNLDYETEIVEACRAGDFKLANERAFTVYGQEIYTFLCARLRSQSDGEEAFSIFAEDMCNALPTFAFRCSVRGYLYTIARNAANRYVQTPHRRAHRDSAVAEDELISAVIARARTTTQLHRRTDIKSKIRELRAQLPDDDQLLLQLHIDRNLPWSEIAMVMLGDTSAAVEAAIERESARLRKRFERVKAELKVLAKAEGLLKD